MTIRSIAAMAAKMARVVGSPTVMQVPGFGYAMVAQSRAGSAASTYDGTRNEKAGHSKRD